VEKATPVISEVLFCGDLVYLVATTIQKAG